MKLLCHMTTPWWTEGQEYTVLRQTKTHYIVNDEDGDKRHIPKHPDHFLQPLLRPNTNSEEEEDQ